MFVGTEAHLVERLAAANAGRVTVEVLAHSICPNMYVTDQQSVLDLLQDWPEKNKVTVPEAVAADAKKALERMLAL